MKYKRIDANQEIFGDYKARKTTNINWCRCYVIWFYVRSGLIIKSSNISLMGYCKWHHRCYCVECYIFCFRYAWSDYSFFVIWLLLTNGLHKRLTQKIWFGFISEFHTTEIWIFFKWQVIFNRCIQNHILLCKQLFVASPLCHLEDNCWKMKYSKES